MSGSRRGTPYFQQYATYPDSFIQLLLGTDPAAIHSRNALHFARIAAHLGRDKEAIMFAQAGLAKASERATIHRSELADILKKYDAIEPACQAGS